MANRYENEDDDRPQTKKYSLVGDVDPTTSIESEFQMNRIIKPGQLISSAFTNIRTVHAYSMESWVSILCIVVLYYV